MKPETIALIIGVSLGLAFIGLGVVVIEIARTLPGLGGFGIGFGLGYIAGKFNRSKNRLKKAIKNESINTTKKHE